MPQSTKKKPSALDCSKRGVCTSAIYHKELGWIGKEYTKKGKS